MQTLFLFPYNGCKDTYYKQICLHFRRFFVRIDKIIGWVAQFTFINWINRHIFRRSTESLYTFPVSILILFTLLSSYCILLHFHTPRLDFHNPDVHFHTIQLSALHYIRCVLTLYSARLNRINSARVPCLFGSRTELIGYGHCILNSNPYTLHLKYTPLTK